MSQHTTNPMVLPDDLPRPEDDGGADHLRGSPMPAIALPSTTGRMIDLSRLRGRSVVYAYPMTGVPNVELPAGWNDIPGARGCTPQTLSFQSQKDVFATLSATIFGLSTQTTAYQQEMSDRLGLSFPILSDADLKLTEALRLPTMTVEGMHLMKRLTLILRDGVVEHVFYPVFPPDRATEDVVAWLRSHPMESREDGVAASVEIYTTPHCPYCRMAKELLIRKGVDFIERDVDGDSKAADEMAARSGGRTVPQIFVGGKHIGGAVDLEAMDRSGRLDAMLGDPE
ncbi:MAG: glutaredoxin 3 [Pseudooceanicola nanhaiensis]|uniref:Glutaredoxin n=1 Tax=Albimonas pacifica TaxID=1114924 RepID=A0A1I3Q2W9_9RHOB|nr:Glutaredoxin, GrxC family [Albimonas pacifica]|tara:strand:+ start:2928 stop:3779 length:852 start_codon:yes stop_codon:yes gene_type:complete